MRFAIHDGFVVDANWLTVIQAEPPAEAKCYHCERTVILKGGGLLGMIFGSLGGTCYYSHLPGQACDYDYAAGDAMLEAYITEWHRRLSQFAKPIQGL